MSKRTRPGTCVLSKVATPPPPTPAPDLLFLTNLNAFLLRWMGREQLQPERVGGVRGIPARIVGVPLHLEGWKHQPPGDEAQKGTVRVRVMVCIIVSLPRKAQIASGGHPLLLCGSTDRLDWVCEIFPF